MVVVCFGFFALVRPLQASGFGNQGVQMRLCRAAARRQIQLLNIALLYTWLKVPAICCQPCTLHCGTLAAAGVLAGTAHLAATHVRISKGATLLWGINAEIAPHHVRAKTQVSSGKRDALLVSCSF